MNEKAKGSLQDSNMCLRLPLNFNSPYRDI